VEQVGQVSQEQVQTDYLQALLYLTCQSFWVTSGRVTLQVGNFSTLSEDNIKKCKRESMER
jgi:hypothetical protein